MGEFSVQVPEVVLPEARLKSLKGRSSSSVVPDMIDTDRLVSGVVDCTVTDSRPALVVGLLALLTVMLPLSVAASAGTARLIAAAMAPTLARMTRDSRIGAPGYALRKISNH